MKVLVAEDDVHMREGIVETLATEGYTTIAAADGASALELFVAERPDFVLLDIMMPGLSGYDVCRKIREQDEGVPILFLSAKSEEIDKVLGLELGADDYVMKPFGVRELLARIRALCRRAMVRRPSEESQTFTLGPIEVIPAELRAVCGDQTVELTLREVVLLRCFCKHPGQVLSRDQLFSAGWGVEHYPNSRTLDQHISKLRRKIESDPKNPTIIRTVHGIGYRFDHA